MQTNKQISCFGRNMNRDTEAGKERERTHLHENTSELFEVTKQNSQASQRPSAAEVRTRVCKRERQS